MADQEATNSQHEGTAKSTLVSARYPAPLAGFCLIDRKLLVLAAPMTHGEARPRSFKLIIIVYRDVSDVDYYV